MNIRVLFLSFLAATALSAQLVEKPASKPASKSAVAPKAKDAPKDLLDLIKAPKTFRGALLEKANDRIALVFRGAWGPAPVISGGGTTTQWSAQVAVLADLDETAGRVKTLGFNMGRKDGKLVARLFHRNSTSQKEVTSIDEGPAQEADGGYVVEFEKSRLVLWPSDGSHTWAPKQAHLYRFLVNGWSAPGQIQPKYNSPAFPNRTQRGLTFAGGSYLVLEDGPIGRIFFAPFGDANLHAMRFVRVAEKVFLDSARRPGAPEGKQEGFAYFSHVWGEGLTGFGQDDGAAIARSIATFKFRQGTKLEEVESVSDNPLFAFSLSGESEEVALDDTAKSEVLDRAKENGWALSGGPFGLKRTLLRAFKGCTIQPPSLSRDDVRQSGIVDLGTKKNASGPAYVKWGSDLYPVKLEEWASLALEAGATFLVDRPARPNPKTGALGQISAPSAPRNQIDQQAKKQSPTQHQGQAPVVFIAGSGPAPHYAYIVDELSAACADAKITAKSGEGSSRNACLEMAMESGAQSLLYVVASVSEKHAYETFVKVQCVSADGTKLWEEEQKGPFMSASVQSTVKSVTEKLVKKVREHFGKPGLPVLKP